MSGMTIGGLRRRARNLAAAMTAVVALLQCSACQDKPEPRAGNAVAAASDAGADSQWWVATLYDLQHEYLATVAQSCLSAGYFERESCIKSKIVDSLSPDGEAASHCSMEDSAPLFIACVDRGTTAERAFVALGLDPQTSMDWNNSGQSLAKASALMGVRLASKCRTSSQRDCLAHEIASMFVLDPSEADRCATSGDTSVQIRCAIGLTLIEKYRSALLYVG